MRMAAIILASAVMGLGLSQVALGVDDSSIGLRGGGKTREALTAMQLKPADGAMWGGLSDWSNGSAMTGESIKDKPVLVVTWSSWYRPTHAAVRSAQALHEKYKDKGLIVVGVHNPRGGESAAEQIKTLGATFPMALDKDGRFRSAIKADQDPNVYVIDRAGNLRFAQVELSSMDAATKIVVDETVEQARDVPTNLASKASEAEKNRWKTREAGAETIKYPDVEFTAPDEEVYKGVKWPYMIGKVEYDPISEKVTNTPTSITLPEENWFPSKPKLDGKIVVIYGFDPQDSDTLTSVPRMNQLQDRYKRDVVVVGVAMKQRVVNQSDEDRKKLVDRNTVMIKSLLQTRTFNHSLVADVLKIERPDSGSGTGQLLLGGSSDRDQSMAIVVCTDNKVRWFDHPSAGSLGVGIEQLIAVDPGVQARRKAEDAKLKAPKDVGTK